MIDYSCHSEKELRSTILFLSEQLDRFLCTEEQVVEYHDQLNEAREELHRREGVPAITPSLSSTVADAPSSLRSDQGFRPANAIL